MKLAIIGVGKLGQDCAEVLAEKFPIVGFDLQPRTPKNFPMAPDLRAAVDGADHVFVAVPTPHDSGYGGEAPTSHLPPKDFDYSALQSVCGELRTLLRPEQTVVVISTVLPGTVRGVLRPALGHERLVYNPYLIAMGSVKWDMVNPEMLIVGCEHGDDPRLSGPLLDIYSKVLVNKPHLAIGTWEEAEAIKIFYNTFISAKIGLVNMILDVAERCGNMDVDVVTSALRDSTQRIMGPRYMHAGMGDAGACHPRDNIALRQLAARLDLGYDLFEAIMSSREKQAANLAKRLLELAEAHDLPIVVHGKAYKPMVAYTDGSYSLLVEHFLREAGRGVEFVDPMTGDARSSDGPAVFLMAHNAAVTYANTGVDSSKAPKAYCEIPPGSVVLDPWRTIAPTSGITVVPYGNTRPGRQPGSRPSAERPE